ncbi:hypothetical protein Q5752_005776 [Cryptotrichosporon argae]
MSAIGLARPGTPFPHAALTHLYHPAHACSGAYPSPYSSASSFAPAPLHAHYGYPHTHASSSSPRALHFRLPELPSPTPPSLLKRQSSSSRSGSDSGASPFSLPGASSYFPRVAYPSPAPSADALAVPPTPELIAPAPRRASSSSTSSFFSSAPPSPALPATPRATPTEPLALPSPLIVDVAEAEAEANEHAFVRPPFKRRDTPRPHAFNALGLSMSDAGARPKTLHSVIDGGAWVVVGTI